MIRSAWTAARLYHSDPKQFPKLEKLIGEPTAKAKKKTEETVWLETFADAGVTVVKDT